MICVNKAEIFLFYIKNIVFFSDLKWCESQCHLCSLQLQWYRYGFKISICYVIHEHSPGKFVSTCSTCKCLYAMFIRMEWCIYQAKDALYTCIHLTFTCRCMSCGDVFVWLKDILVSFTLFSQKSWELTMMKTSICLTIGTQMEQSISTSTVATETMQQVSTLLCK